MARLVYVVALLKSFTKGTFVETRCGLVQKTLLLRSATGWPAERSACESVIGRGGLGRSGYCRGGYWDGCCCRVRGRRSCVRRRSHRRLYGCESHSCCRRSCCSASPSE